MMDGNQYHAKCARSPGAEGLSQGLTCRRRRSRPRAANSVALISLPTGHHRSIPRLITGSSVDAAAAGWAGAAEASLRISRSRRTTMATIAETASAAST